MAKLYIAVQEIYKKKKKKAYMSHEGTACREESKIPTDADKGISVPIPFEKRCGSVATTRDFVAVQFALVFSRRHSATLGEGSRILSWDPSALY